LERRAAQNEVATCGRDAAAAVPIKPLILPTVDAAWAEMTKVCGDLVGSIARSPKQNGKWEVELLDESKTPTIRLVAETLD
jgi:hypothetical protein